MANEQGKAQCQIAVFSDVWFEWVTSRVCSESLLERSAKEGDSPVHH